MAAAEAAAAASAPASAAAGKQDDKTSADYYFDSYSHFGQLGGFGRRVLFGGGRARAHKKTRPKSPNKKTPCTPR
jgi:hypothetical protein